MTEQEITRKIIQCRNDINSTESHYRKNDLRKYEKKLLKQLKKIRGSAI